jgi:NIMA (never in mitosis gene a)-related kinase
MKAKKPFEEKEIWSVAYCLVKALRSLRSRKIIHRDIKSANIFLSGGKAKLGDMNVSKVTKMAYAYSQAGTPYYTSPEVWREEPYSY